MRRGEGEKLPDIVWLNADGKEMLPEDWDSGFGRSIGVFLNGDGIRGVDSRGRRITDVNFLLSSTPTTTTWTSRCPPDEYAPTWDVVIDTAGEYADTQVLDAGASLGVSGKAMVVLRAHSGAGRGAGPFGGRLAGGAGGNEPGDGPRNAGPLPQGPLPQGPLPQDRQP